MVELPKGMLLKRFIANKKQWRTWAEFIESLHTYLLPRDFFSRLADHGMATESGLQRVVPGSHDRHPDYDEATQLLAERDPKHYLGVLYTESKDLPKVSELDSLMILADEYEELKKEREAFAQENKFSRTKSSTPT